MIDAAARMGLAAKPSGAGQGGGLLARGEHARHAEIDERLQRGQRVGRHVEGAMKDRLFCSRPLDDLPRARPVDRAVFA